MSHVEAGEGRPGWRRWSRWAAWAVVGALVISAGWYYCTPWGSDYRLERRIESLCGGVLDAGQMLALAEDPEDDGRPDTDADDIDDGAAGRWEECGVGDVEVRLADVPDRPDRAEDIHLIALVGSQGWPHGAVAVPLGNGWAGFVTWDATVTVALPCAGSAGRHIVVEASDRRLRDDGQDVFAGADDPRLPLARATTDIAVRAADAWDCRTTPGRPLDRVPQPVSWEEGGIEPGETDGTCAGLPVGLDDRVATAWETSTDPNALLEHCSLGNDDQQQTYSLTAYYGPSAQAARRDYASIYGTRPELDGLTPDTAPSGQLPPGTAGLWASARCPDSNQRALYLLNLRRIDPDPRAGTDDDEIAWWDEEWAEQGRLAPEALTAFAEQSAARHGCTDLRLP